ncbi:MAG: NO-binding membrane sensor protein with MHYT domain [Verrucomicrobiales bacterium]|jgi:NO-binding membrane sensor protein with MHYT domain
MNPNWLGVISSILAFVAFFVVFRAAKDTSNKTRLLLFLLALVAAIPGASFAAYYAHVLPEPNWYYQFRSIAGTELLVVLIGISGGLFAILLPRMLLILPLLGVTAFSIAPIIKPFIGPIAAGTIRDKG